MPTTEHRDADTVRRLPGALQSFAVTPTLYFHANIRAAVARAVGVESVAIDVRGVALAVLGAALVMASMAFAPLARAQQQEAPAAPGGTVARLAGSAGVQTCLDATRRFGPALTGATGSSTAVVMAHPVAPDAASFGVTIARSDAGPTRLVDATFSPTLRGNCDLSYDKVDVWRKSCQDVALEELHYTRELGRLSEQTSVIAYSPTHHIYLIRIAGGCVGVTKELVYP